MITSTPLPLPLPLLLPLEKQLEQLCSPPWLAYHDHRFLSQHLARPQPSPE